jgi:hypothetical protein
VISRTTFFALASHVARSARESGESGEEGRSRRCGGGEEEGAGNEVPGTGVWTEKDEEVSRVVEDEGGERCVGAAAAGGFAEVV